MQRGLLEPKVDDNSHDFETKVLKGPIGDVQTKVVFERSYTLCRLDPEKGSLLAIAHR